VITGRTQDLAGFTPVVASLELALTSCEGTFALESFAMIPAPRCKCVGFSASFRRGSIHRLNTESTAECGFVPDSEQA